MPGSTSYFSAPASQLDPKLFDENGLKPWARSGILSILFDYLGTHYANPQQWAHVWLAGSGVSYQWEAAREPGDLDCLIGIDYVKFRQGNPGFSGFSDQEIAQQFNEEFNTHIMPNTRNWEGYELTFYVNPQSDIRDINPYAAYDLTADTWTVEPERNPQPPYSRAWEQRAQRDHEMAEEMVKRYSGSLNELKNATNPAHRVNAERKLNQAADQAIAFFEDIHSGRKIAFSKIGSGYADYNNYRWQAGKKSGAIQALRSIKDQRKSVEASHQKETYGVELPNTSALIRRTLRG
jgi:hypothetical protein